MGQDVSKIVYDPNKSTSPTDDLTPTDNSNHSSANQNNEEKAQRIGTILNRSRQGKE